MAFHFTIPQASIQDTLRYIINFINKYSADSFAADFAKQLDPSGDKQQFIKRLFDYICQNGYYKLDEDGEEEVWTPAKTIRTRNDQGKFQYDCKKITILIGSVLKAAGIEPVLKHVYYSDGQGGFKDYTHIYIIVPYPDMDHYLTVDPTNNCQWNTEVDHDKATLYFLNGTKQETAPMNLHLMGNGNQTKNNPSVLSMFGESAGCIENDMNAITGRSVNIGNYNYQADRIGLKNDYFTYTASEALGHAAKVPLLFIPRGAFLGLLYLGKLLANTPLKLNWASRLARAWQANKSQVRKTWWKLGGTADAAALKTAIIKGSGITISGPIGQGYDYPLDLVTPYLIELKGNRTGMNGPELAAAIVAAAPVIAALLSMAKNMGIVKEGETDPPVDPGTVPLPLPPGPAPVAGSILDFSSPVNTIVKSVFLMGISGMISGPSYYILNIFCMGSICFSVIKSFR